MIIKIISALILHLSNGKVMICPGYCTKTQRDCLKMKHGQIGMRWGNRLAGVAKRMADRRAIAHLLDLGR